VNDDIVGSGSAVSLEEGDTVSFGPAKTEGYYFRTTILPDDASLESLYHLIDLIGEGSFGRVYKAVNRDTGRIYACKVVVMQSYKRRLYGTEVASAQIMQEISVVVTLQHPNICQIKEWFYDDERGIFSTYNKYEQWN
ncbi:hypothetical protein EIP86_005227, partial [Pleurotus ostreatoroseus]